LSNFEFRKMNSTRQRGGRRKFGDHGSGRNDDGNGLAVAVTAKDDDGSGATRRGVDSTGFLLLANQKKDLTGDYFNWESLLQFSDTGNIYVVDILVVPRPKIFMT